MSFKLQKQNQSKSQFADEESMKPKLLSQNLEKTKAEELSKEIKHTISIGMETPGGVTEKNPKSDFAYYSLIIAGFVVVGVVGYIYYSIDKIKPKPKSKN